MMSYQIACIGTEWYSTSVQILVYFSAFQFLWMSCYQRFLYEEKRISVYCKHYFYCFTWQVTSDFMSCCCVSCEFIANVSCCHVRRYTSTSLSRLPLVSHIFSKSDTFEISFVYSEFLYIWYDHWILQLQDNWNIKF